MQLNRFVAQLGTQKMTTSLHEPEWSLERRESSGTLVWRKESPRSKVRFRFDVEVLEFEKHPHEDFEKDDGFTLSKVSVFCATCLAAIAVSLFFPWYLLEKAGSI